MSQRLSPRNEVADQPLVEVADKDDGGGVVRLGHDGRLPLQVLGDEGDVESSPPSEPQNEIVGQLCQVWQVGVSL